MENLSMLSCASEQKKLPLRTTTMVKFRKLILSAIYKFPEILRRNFLLTLFGNGALLPVPRLVTTANSIKTANKKLLSFGKGKISFTSPGFMLAMQAAVRSKTKSNSIYAK